MPWVNSYFRYELATGVRVAATISVILAFPMIIVGCSSRYRYPEIGLSYVAFGVLYLFSAAGLYIGAHKKNHNYAWPWLLTTGLAIPCFLFLLCAFGVGIVFPTIELVIIFLTIIVLVHCFIIVFSFVQQMKAQPVINQNKIEPIADSKVPVIPPRAEMPTQLYPSPPMADIFQSNTQPISNISSILPPIHYPPQQWPAKSQFQPCIGYTPSLYSMSNPQPTTQAQTTPNQFPIYSSLNTSNQDQNPSNQYQQNNPSEHNALN